MANITTSTLSGTMRAAYVISREINLLLKDSANLRNTGYLTYGGSVNGSGSTVKRLRQIGLMGRDSFSAPSNEDDAASATTPDDAFAALTVARQVLMYSLTDLSSITSFGDSPFELNPENLAASIAASYETRFAELTAAAATSITASTATSGLALSVSGLFEAIYTLEQADTFLGAPGPFYACLHPKSLTELQSSLRAEQNNIVSNMTATEQMIASKGLGYAGQIFGVDIYRSSHIQSDGTDYENWMADAGCIAYIDGVPQIVGATEVMQFEKCAVEMHRQADKALTQIIGHAYMGFGVLNTNRGVRLLAVD